MKALKTLIIGLSIMAMLPIASQAQQNCADFFKTRKPEFPYRYNTASKSATVWSGKKYEFVLPITTGNEYRIRFYAASVFNNELQVKIIDMNTNETIIDLPGAVETPKKGTTCLQDYMDEKTRKIVHPYFDIVPSQSTSLKIMIDMKDHLEYKEEPILDAEGYPTGEVKRTPIIPEGGIIQVKGCFTVYVSDKPSDKNSFE